VEVRDIHILRSLAISTALCSPLEAYYHSFVALYLTVIYILLFTFLDGYTHIFTETYGLSGLTGLAFVASVPVSSALASSFAEDILWGAPRSEGPEQGGTAWLLSWAVCTSHNFEHQQSGRCTHHGLDVLPASRVGYLRGLCSFFGFGILCVFISSYQYYRRIWNVFGLSTL